MFAAMMPSRHERLLLARCATEPIHRLGRTQAFGVLVAFDADCRVAAVSGNAQEWLGKPAQTLLGQPADALLPATSVDAARAHAVVANHRQAAQHLFGVHWPGRTQAVDVSIHASGPLVVVEAEPSGPGPARATQVMEACTRELALADDMPTLAESAARAVAGVTGFDRVMVYRFSADGSGTVVAEQLAADLPRYKGLRYPASDIPEQARQLYLRNTTRLIVDAQDEGLPLAMRLSEAPDLSLSVLRSVSPVHLQYMRNMGSAASMSISLIVDGRLWGLIACHHGRPIRPDLSTRTLAALMGRLYSLALSRIERQGLDRNIRSLLLTPPGVEPLVIPGSSASVAESVCARLAALFGLSGCVARIDGYTLQWGRTPPIGQADALLSGLPRSDDAAVQAFDCLADIRPAWRKLAPDAAGALILRLDSTGRNGVLLLRDEVRRHVTWAGRPAKQHDRDTGLLTPRSSFAAWHTAMKGHCEPWAMAEIDLARILRVRLLEVLLAYREQRELSSAHEAARRQALLIKELNHRVRNMLGLIQGLVRQTAQRSATVEDLAVRLDERVLALSRAYTQVEQAGWQPTPLARLLLDETAAFAEPGQVDIDGDPTLLEPGACLSMALVIHELATNARKYGALSTPMGRLQVHWRLHARSGLALSWRESGGPPVRPPRRQGFGTRVIEQAVTRQLAGTVNFDFRAKGLVVQLHIARGAASGPAQAAAQAARWEPRPARGVSGTVLVVEDDPVISLMAETTLQRMGAQQVVLAGSESDALRALKLHAFDLALLDVNLGDHTSAGIARRLSALGVPAIVTTGYSETDDLPVPLRRLPHIRKPYGQADIEQAISDAGP